MKLSLMKKYFDTVDEDRKSPINDQIARHWFNTEFEAKTLRASSNFVCVVNAEKTYYLRFNHVDERAQKYIEAEIKYLQHLIEKGVKVNKPVPSLNDRLVESVDTELGTMYCVLFEEVPGNHIEIQDLDLDGFEAWGRALGELHEATKGYTGDRPSWREHAAFIRSMLPESETVVLRLLSSVEESLEMLPVDDSCFGVIHYDFELDNIRWCDGVPGFMDFDDCVYHWYAADIIIGISELFDDKIENIDTSDTRFQAFLSGYKSRRIVNDWELENLPNFLLLDTLYKYARVYRSTIDGPIEGEPEWTTRLRKHLVNNYMKTVQELEKHVLL